MKKIYLIGFRGTSFQALEYKAELALIRAGHVGFAFENDSQFMLGFHPTPKRLKRWGVKQQQSSG